MSRFWKTALAIWGVVSATLFFMSTVPVSIAKTNLASWADMFGLTFIAHIVGTTYADTVGQVFAIVSALAITVLVSGLSQQAHNLLKKEGWNLDPFHRIETEDKEPPPSN